MMRPSSSLTPASAAECAVGLDHIFKVLATRSVLVDDVRDNPHFDVLAHVVEFPRTGAPQQQFFTIEHKFYACAAVCLDDEDRVLLLRVPRFPHRHTIGDEWFLELPGGRSESEETAEDCVRRELIEECGLVADALTPLLKDYFYPESSFSTEKLFLYLARGIRHVGGSIPEVETELEGQWFSLDEAVEMVFNGKIRSSWSIIGILATKLLRANP